jgi:hypothetical protein
MPVNIYFFALYTIYVSFALFDFFNTKQKPKVFLLTFSVLFLSFVLGMRGRVGKDYYEYIRIFKESGTIGDLINGTFDHTFIHTEPLFTFINMILNSLNAEFYIMFFVFAFISLSVNHIAIKKYSPYVFLSILIYISHSFLLKELIQVRSGIASSILLFGIAYLYNKEFKKYTIVILAASLFHKGAIIAFFLYLFNMFDFKKKTLYLLLFAAIVVSFIGVFDIAIHLLQSINAIPKQAELYLSWDKYIEPLGLTNPTTMKQILLSLFFIYHKDFFIEKLPYFKAMLYMYLFSTMWLIIVADFGIFAGRLAAYFSFVEVLLIPSMILLTKNKLKKFIIFTGIVIYSLLLAYINLVPKHVVRAFYFFFEYSAPTN